MKKHKKYDPMKAPPLPEKLSDCIDLALKDLRAVLRSPRQFRVNMGTWFESYGKYCTVCFAGSVMAQTLGAVGSGYELHPNSFSDHNRVRLFALNLIREGWVGHAVVETGMYLPFAADYCVPVASFTENAKDWFADMAYIARMLRRKGL